MNEQSRTNAELVEEISGLKQKIQELEQAETERKQVEVALRESKELYRTFINATSDMVCLKDEQFRNIVVNKSMVAFFGKTEGEIIGKSDFELMAQTAAEKCRQTDLETLSNKSIFISEEIVGNQWYQTLKFPVELGHNRVGVGGFIRDITDHKRVTEALKEKEKFMDSIIQSSAVATFVINADHKVIYWNGACEDLTGIKSEDLIGTSDHWKAFYDHFRPCVADVIIDNKINEMTNFYKVYAKSVLIPDGIRAEGWYPNLGGKNRYVVFDAAPIRDENGKLIAAIETLQDITERKRAEADLKETLDSLRKSFSTIVQVMVSTVESRDAYTAGHQVRSADLARAIATEMELPQDKIEGLRMAGSIHDIGKISIPAEILSKPTKLSEIEFALIKEHSRIGYEMLKDVESPWPLAQIVYQHHERMDGSGYPRNLKGEEICMEARILAVADVVEAMASHRPYRPSLGIDAALKEIEKNRGIFYDEAVVDACLRLFREKEFKLENT